MCRAASHQATGNIICIYCGSTNHTSGKCHSKPINNREELRSTPRDLRDQGPRINYSRMDHQPQVSKCHSKPNDNREELRSTPRDLRDQGPRINYSRMGHQPQVSCHQTRFN